MKHKRLLCLFCCLFLLLPLMSCERVGDEGHSTENKTGSDTAPVSVDDPKDDYTTLERRKIRNMSETLFCFEGDNNALGITLPDDWLVETDSNGGYRFMREGREVGWLKSGEEELSVAAEVMESDDSDNYRVHVDWELAYEPEAEFSESGYCHRYLFSYPHENGTRLMTACIDYTELNDFATRKIMFSSEMRKRVSDTAFHLINLKPGDRYKPVLLLGNSFIGSSDIGNILRSMLRENGKSDVEIQAVSVGYATVSQSWESYLYRMRNGEFAAVFMCGFYGSSDVTAFAQYVDACQASGTPIVIFPAHNEGNGDAAIRSYPKVPSLNWKGEIDMLIRAGVPRADFCIPDQHSHSTPLAGYVGAHMIYRALFGEVPRPAEYYGYSLSHEEIVEKLGDYTRTGYLVLIKDEKLHFLK